MYIFICNLNSPLFYLNVGKVRKTRKALVKFRSLKIQESCQQFLGCQNKDRQTDQHSFIYSFCNLSYDRCTGVKNYGGDR